MIEPRPFVERRERVEIDGHVVGLKREGLAARALHLEAQQALVHRSQVLHVERPRRHVRAVVDREQIEHPQHDAVGDRRQLVGLGAAGHTAFEKGMGIGVEERAGAGALVQPAEPRDDVTPGPMALLDRRIAASLVLPQPRVEALQRARRRLWPRRQEAPLLREQHEGHPDDHGDEARVDVFRRPPEDPLTAPAIGALKTSEQHAERRERLRAQGPGEEVVVIEARLGATQGRLTEPAGSSAPHPNSCVSIIGANGCGS